MSAITVWINREPYCAACGEHLGTEEADWGCFACGGEGFDDGDGEDNLDHAVDKECAR